MAGLAAAALFGLAFAFTLATILGEPGPPPVTNATSPLATPTTTSAEKSSTRVPDVELRTEVLRYYVEVATDGDRSTRATTPSQVGPDRKFKLHFVASQPGYLYIVAPEGSANDPKAFLTGIGRDAQANRLEPNAEFEFPIPDDLWLFVDASLPVTRFTAIFSPRPIATPGFLAERAFRRLTPREMEELDDFRTRHGDARSEILPALPQGRPFTAVTTSRDRARDEPILFDIDVRSH